MRKKEIKGKICTDFVFRENFHLLAGDVTKWNFDGKYFSLLVSLNIFWKIYKYNNFWKKIVFPKLLFVYRIKIFHWIIHVRVQYHIQHISSPRSQYYITRRLFPINDPSIKCIPRIGCTLKYSRDRSRCTLQVHFRKRFELHNESQFPDTVTIHVFPYMFWRLMKNMGNLLIILYVNWKI